MSVDLLSALPLSLILHILSFMEMRDVVKTTLLSKAWKDLWTTTTSLDFDETMKAAAQSRNFINQVILHRWRGSKILKLKISFGRNYDASLCRDVDYWVSLAAEKKVEELHLIQLAYNFRNPDPVHFLPHCLYSCSSLTKLTLIGFSFRIHDVQLELTQLKNLLIIGQCLGEDFVNQLISSSPKLEILEAHVSGSHQKLGVESSSLKKLALTTGLHDPSNYTALAIWAPNLETLAVSGQYSRCLLLNAPSLNRVSLYFRDTCHLRVEAMLKQVLPAIQQVEELWLSLCCFKMLGVMKDKYSFLNVKKLKLRGGPIEPYDVVGITEYFPKMEKLLIKWRCDNWFALFLENLSQKHDIGEENNLEQAEARNPKPLLMQLTALELSWQSCDATKLRKIFEFVKFVLNHATMLQKIVIKRSVNDVGQVDSLILIAREVMSLRREFPAIEFSFSYT